MSFPRLYLDTKDFIYAFENNDAIARGLAWLLGYSGGKRQSFLATSEITPAELLVDPLKRKDGRLVDLYGNIAFGNALVVIGAVTREILWHAALLRSDSMSLRLPDAIHLTTAMHFGCARFMTADARPKDFCSIEADSLVPCELHRQVSIIRPDIGTLVDILAEIEG